MASFLPVALYGLEVPPGEILIPASPDFPAHFRITMAAIDPSEPPEADEDGNIPAVPRATLKLIKHRYDGLGDSDDSDESFDDEELEALLNADSEDDEDDDDDSGDEPNGGPSDPSKSKKQRDAAAIAKLLGAADEDEDDEDEDEDEEMANGELNGTKLGKKGKGKAKALDSDDEEDSDIEDDMPNQAIEEFVICTLDTERNFQQPIDIHVSEGESVFFTVSGTHSVFLTGNYVISPDEGFDDTDSEDGDYDLDLKDIDDSLVGGFDDESDELDDVPDPRIAEVDSEDEEVPKLITDAKTGKNKRPAESDEEDLDEMITNSKAEATKLSKKQAKKLKSNKGEAVPASDNKKQAQKNGIQNKADKKVQFAKELEQGPTTSTKDAGKQAPKESGKEKKGDKPTVGVKTVQGVTIDDRKVGTGRAVKNGDVVSLRYIGKLTNGKVFDANKKGKPFSFTVGKGSVIKGWEVGLLGMTISGERRLTIPPKLAYGSKNMPDIPANSTLIFDIKLLEIK